MKAFDFLVGRLYTVPLQSIIIVKHHGIHAEYNDLRLRDLESPDEEVLKQSPKQESTHIRKLAEQSFDRMRRSQIATANDSSITFICLQMIKPGDVATGAVHEKTEQLNK